MMPACGNQGKPGKNRKHRPPFRDNQGHYFQGRQKEEKPDQQKKGSQKQVNRPLVELYRQKRAGGTGNDKKERTQYGNLGCFGQAAQEKPAAQKHEQKTENKNKPGGYFMAYTLTHKDNYTAIRLTLPIRINP
jgi:hypothetical protein